MQKRSRLKKCTAPALFPAPDARDTFGYERLLQAQGYARVAGTDEAGRGPLAGPVVAACVILPESVEYRQYVDSKILSEKARLHLAGLLRLHGAAIGIGIVDSQTIDRINILQASLLAMQQAFANLSRSFTPPDYLLVDGIFPVPADIPQLSLKQGESRSCSIAAASIIAKTTRDALMLELHEKYPQYGFARHKGYPTRAHREALRRYGPSPVHRLTFRGVQNDVS